MRMLLLLVPLFALLAGALWFAYGAWSHFGMESLPAQGWLAMAGGILFSLLIGCGLMALMFNSSRHGYDDQSRGDRQ